VTPLSHRQYEACTLGQRDHRFHYCVGSVRSGKTWAAIRGFLHFAGRCYSNSEFALVAHSWKQMRGVVLKNVADWLGEIGLPYEPWSMEPKSIRIRDCHGGHNTFYLIIGNQTASVKSIDGLTLSGVFIDEMVHIPEEIIDAVVMRCSQPGAKIVSTMNPGGPLHFVKRTWIDPTVEDGSGELLTFALHDNPTLHDDYIAMLHKRFTGAQLQRKVYGLWAATSGAVWPEFHKAVKKPPEDEEPWRFEVSGDYAASSITHAILWARYPKATWAIKEWRWDGDAEGAMPIADQATAMVQSFVSSGEKRRNVAAWVIDPTAEGLISELRIALQKHEEPDGRVMGAYNDVADGLNVTTQWLENKRIYVAPWLRETIAECSGYSWDENAGARGEDRPARGADHAADAVRYYCATRAMAEAKRGLSPTPVRGGT